MFIYVIVCSESLKLYVGQHGGADLGKYLSRKFYDAHRAYRGHSMLYNAMRKHPRESWSIWPLVSNIETRAELDEVEKHFIRVLKTQHPDIGYNICDGGEGHRGPLSEETKQKISAHHKGTNYRYKNGFVPQTQDEIEQRRQKQIGQKRTPEQRQHISAAVTGKNLGNRYASGKRSGVALANVLEGNARYWTPERRAEQAKRIEEYNRCRA